MKSRQTTPVTASGFVAGTTACFAPAGTSVGGIAVSPSSAVPPGRTGFFRTIPFCGEPTRTALDGAAFESTPGGRNSSWNTPTTALSVPLAGSFSSIRRQITPVANNEIASGMKTIVLKTTPQLIRSIRTAKTSPIAVTKAGTTATQIRLFLIAVRRTSVVKIDL